MNALSLVYNQSQVDQFISLMELYNNSELSYYMMLVLRDKETDTRIKRGKTIISRNCVSYGDLKEEKLDNWLHRVFLDEYEKEMATVYFNINPRNAKHALNEYMNDITKNIMFSTNVNFIKLLLNSKNYLHRCSDNKSLVMFDIDTKEETLVKEFQKMFLKFKEGYFFCIETKNGYHLIFDKRKLKKLTNDLFKLNLNFTYTEKDRSGKSITKTYISISKETSVVVPGTLQRNFEAKFVNFFENIL